MTKKKYKVAESYAISNNPYKIGDIIKDHCHIIELQQIKLYYDKYNPSCIYHGIELKKDLTPTVKQANTCMHQMNVECKLEK